MAWQRAHAFDGVVAANVGGGPAPDPFTGKPLRMHVRTCSETEIHSPRACCHLSAARCQAATRSSSARGVNAG